jgi:hypothetical protein
MILEILFLLKFSFIKNLRFIGVYIKLWPENSIFVFILSNITLYFVFIFSLYRIMTRKAH